MLYRDEFPRRDVFPLVPPPSEMARTAKEARVHKKLVHEQLCSYHRGTVERAKVKDCLLIFLDWDNITCICVFMSLLTRPTTVISINNIIFNIMDFWKKVCSFIHRLNINR